MPTIDDILNQMKFERLAGGGEGSCFGVTDPSRLRPAFRRHPKKDNGLCEGCDGKKRHHCKGFVLYVSVVTNPKHGRLKIKRLRKPCRCQKSYCKRERK